MASFTDELMTYNPHIQQLPVDDMINVGMLKQKQYEEGVARVQAQISSIAGLDVMKDEHKQYLQQRVNQLQTETSKVVGGDFSKQQLQNSIGGLIRHISGDRIIQGAVMSTQRARKGQAALEEARTTGKGYSIENEYAFNSDLSKWLGDKNADTAFSGSYTPYIDVKKKMLDVIKTIDPSSTLTDMPFTTDAAGNIEIDKTTGLPKIDYAMVEKSFKGKDASRIAAAVYNSLDENDLNQLAISGKYHYRNYTPQDLQKTVNNNITAKGQNLTAHLNDLRIQKVANANDPQALEAIDDQINLVTDGISNLQKDYKSTMTRLEADPEGFKSEFYTNNTIEGIGQAFQSSETTNKVLENPKYKGFMEEQKFMLENEKYKLDIQKLEIERFKADTERMKALKEKKTKEDETSAPGTLAPIDTAGVVTPTEYSIIDQISSRVNEKDGVIDDVLKTAIPDVDFTQLARDAGFTTPAQIAAYKATKFDALKKAYESGGQIPQNLVSSVQRIDGLQKQISTSNLILKKAREEANKNFPGFETQDLAKQVDGGNITLNSPGDAYVGKLGMLLSPAFFMANSTIGHKSTPLSLSSEDIVNLATIKLNRGNLVNKEEKRRRADAEAALIKKYGKEQGEGLASLMDIASGPTRDMTDLSPINDQIDKATQLIKSKNYNERTALLNQKLSDLGVVGAPISYNIMTGKDEAAKDTKNLVRDIIAEGELVGGVPDKSDITANLNDAKGTSFKVVHQPMGDANAEGYTLHIIDSKGTDAVIKINKERAEQLTGREFTPSIDPVEARIRASQTKSTNEKGNDPETAFYNKDAFPLVKNEYALKGDIIQDNQNPNAYYTRIYVFDKPNNKWITKDVTLGGGVSLEAAKNTLTKISPAVVKQLIESKAP